MMLRSSLLSLEVRIEIVERGGGAIDALGIVRMGERNAFDQSSDAVCFRPAETLFLQIDVVHDLGDRAQRAIAPADMIEKHLERAAVPLVRELGLEHVEADLIARRRVFLRAHEAERGAGVDEAADQPGAGDAIDVNAGARDPDFVPKLARRRAMITRPT